MANPPPSRKKYVVLVQAVITKRPYAGCLKQQTFTSHRVLADHRVSDKNLLPGLPTTLLCPHMAKSRERANKLSGLFL